MKKIVLLSAALLVMVAAFATDTPTHAPHNLHPGYLPLYGHGIHPRPLHPAHKPFQLVAGHDVRTAFVRPMPVIKEAPSIRVSLPGFAEADAAVHASAIVELTTISLPDFRQADASVNESAIVALTTISLPDFRQADALVNASAIVEMTEISLPDFAQADADMSSRWSLVVSH